MLTIAIIHSGFIQHQRVFCKFRLVSYIDKIQMYQRIK